MIQRGNDRRAGFFSDEDREAYLDWLLAAARKHGCLIHAYVLMTNDVYLLATPARPTACRAWCSRLAGVMCATSTTRMGAPAPCGNGATGRRRSTVTAICTSARATSN